MPDTPKYRCKRCQTQYYKAGECDWCVGQHLELVVEGDCETQLVRAYKRIETLEVKAKRWDAALLACHRMGGQCAEVIKKVIESVRRY